MSVTVAAGDFPTELLGDAAGTLAVCHPAQDILAVASGPRLVAYSLATRQRAFVYPLAGRPVLEMRFVGEMLAVVCQEGGVFVFEAHTGLTLFASEAVMDPKQAAGPFTFSRVAAEFASRKGGQEGDAAYLLSVFFHPPGAKSVKEVKLYQGSQICYSTKYKFPANQAMAVKGICCSGIRVAIATRKEVTALGACGPRSRRTSATAAASSC